MPWVDNDDCVGCGICADQCPVDAIRMEDNKAIIDMDSCIRCGICHGICPKNAVKHDSEKIHDEVEANVAYTRELMRACAEHLGDESEKQKCLNRLIKHFKKDKLVAEKTLEKIEALKGE